MECVYPTTDVGGESGAFGFGSDVVQHEPCTLASAPFFPACRRAFNFPIPIPAMVAVINRRPAQGLGQILAPAIILNRRQFRQPGMFCRPLIAPWHFPQAPWLEPPPSRSPVVKNRDGLLCPQPFRRAGGKPGPHKGGQWSDLPTTPPYFHTAGPRRRKPRPLRIPPSPVQTSSRSHGKKATNRFPL